MLLYVFKCLCRRFGDRVGELSVLAGRKPGGWTLNHCSQSTAPASLPGETQLSHLAPTKPFTPCASPISRTENGVYSFG